MKKLVNSIFNNINRNITIKNNYNKINSEILQSSNFISNNFINNYGKIKLDTKQYDDLNTKKIKIINTGHFDFNNKIQNKSENSLNYSKESINDIINKETDESYYNEINSILDSLNENKKDNIFSSNEEEIKKINQEHNKSSYGEIESIIDTFNQPKINKVKVESVKNLTNINKQTTKPLTIYESIINKQQIKSNNDNPIKTNQKIDRPKNEKYFFKKIKQITLYETILDSKKNQIIQRPNNYLNKERQDFSLYSKININKPIEKQETLANKEKEQENKKTMIPYLNKFISQKETLFNRIEPIRLSRIKIQNTSKNYCESELFKKLLNNKESNIKFR